jgi:predicted ester cyclase
MSTESNKAILRRLDDEVFNHGNLSIIDEVVSADFVNHDPFPGEPPGREGFKQIATMLRAAFSDLHLTHEEMIAEGDLVAERFTMRGTHTGTFLGFSPTGRQVTMRGIDILQFADGQVVARWARTDDLGLMHQLNGSER